MRANRMTVWIFSVLMVIFLVGCNRGQPTFYGYPNNMIGVPIPRNYTVIRHFDTHGGSHGDGTFFIELKLNQQETDSMQLSIAHNSKWSIGRVPSDVLNWINSGHSTNSLGIPQPGTKSMSYFHNLSTGAQTSDDLEVILKKVRLIAKKNSKDSRIPKLLFKVPSSWTFALLDVTNQRLYIVRSDL